MKITGQSHILFILAHPVAYVKGTNTLNEMFEAQGVDAAVSPLHIHPDDLAQFILTVRKIRNVAGFGVTIPHKINVVPHLDRLTERAQLVGSVNFVRRDEDGTLTGDNIDGAGFVDGLHTHGFSLKGKRVLQLGAGGAGRAVAFAIADEGVSELRIHNRTASKAAALAAEIATSHPGLMVGAGDADPSGFDVIVNTTSNGMQAGDALPFEPDLLTPDMLVAEIIMTPEMTPLLTEAKARGCSLSLGKPMLVEQFKLVRKLLEI